MKKLQFKKHYISVMLLGLAMALVLPMQAMATNGMRLIGYGAVQRSMGGASVAMPLDAATIMSNPAGMTAIDNQVTLGATHFTPTSSIDKVDNGGGQGPKVESETGASTMPGVGTFFGSDNFKFGLAAYGAAGMGVDYQGTAIYGGPAKSSYEMLKVAPAFAFKMGGLSIGASYNHGQASMGFQAGPPVSPEAKKNTQTGSGYTIGALLEMGFLSLGFAQESKQDFKAFQFDGLTGELDLDQPPVTTYGIGLNFGALRIAYDVSNIQWSKTLGENMPESTLPGAYGTFNLNWKDQKVMKVGAQLDIGKEFQVRMGFNRGEDPTDHDQAFETLLFPAIVENHNTYGASWFINPNAKLDIAYMHVPKVTAAGSNAAQGILNYETSLEENSMEVSYSYIF